MHKLEIMNGVIRSKKRKPEDGVVLSNSDDSDSKFKIMRSCLPEFDPDSGPQLDHKRQTLDGRETHNLLRAWQTYVETFLDLCQLESISQDETKKKLLLLLMGYKMRLQLEKMGANQGNFQQTVASIGHYFSQRRRLRGSRFDFLFSSSVSTPMLKEKASEWLSRLRVLAQHSNFQDLTEDEAIVLVMCKNAKCINVKKKILESETLSPEEAAALILSSTSSLQDKRKEDIKEGDDEEEGGGEEEEEVPVKVELEWGDSDHASNEAHMLNGHHDDDDDDDDDLLEDDQDYYDDPFHLKTSPSPLKSEEKEILLPGSSSTSAPPSSSRAATTTSLSRTPMTHPVVVIPPSSSKRKNGCMAGAPLPPSRFRNSCTCPNCLASPAGIRPSKHNCHMPGCGKEYSKASHLRAHLHSHSLVLPFGCEWPGCEKRFYRSDQLTRHSRTHTGEKKFKCSICEKAFSR